MTALNLNKINFDALKNTPLQDLLAFQGILNEAIEERRVSEKNELLEKINALASESGYSLDDLFSGKSKTMKKSVAVKYRHPDDVTLTWTGRGRKPKWIQGELDAGKTLEDLEI